MPDYDAVIVGAGPNGLAAGIVLARAGWSVRIFEGKPTIGGGARTAELTLPGFLHDICSAIHPLGLASPLMRSLPLHEHGLEWIHADAPLAHPFPDGRVMLLEKSLEATAAHLGKDGRRYVQLMRPYVENLQGLLHDILGPLRIPPSHPFLLARFGLPALMSTTGLSKALFREKYAPALLAGLAAHSCVPLERVANASFGLVLGMLGHAVGWPIPKGGSQSIVNAMASYFQSLGGEITTGQFIENIDELPPARAVLLDITPRQLLRMAGHKLPEAYQARLRRYRYGPGAFKIDWALDGPIPWKNPDIMRAGTVHLGGTIDAIARSERESWSGQPPEKPYIILAQQSLFDRSRSPEGQHAIWGYCHVPHGSTFDMTERMENHIEEYAPGFRERILARAVKNAVDMEAYNPNYIGGDINGGVQDLGQLFTRPVPRFPPYSTPLKGVYLCSSATPPGGGVHGMCGYFAARAAMRARL